MCGLLAILADTKHFISTLFPTWLVNTCVSMSYSVRIPSYSGPYSVRMRENTGQNNSEYGYVFCSVCIKV